MPRAGEWGNKIEHKLTKGKIKQCPPCAFLPSLFMAFLCNFPLKSPQLPPPATRPFSSSRFSFPPQKKKTPLFPLRPAPSCCPKFSNALLPQKSSSFSFRFFFPSCSPGIPCQLSPRFFFPSPFSIFHSKPLPTPLLLHSASMAPLTTSMADHLDLLPPPAHLMCREGVPPFA